MSDGREARDDGPNVLSKQACSRDDENRKNRDWFSEEDYTTRFRVKIFRTAQTYSKSTKEEKYSKFYQ